MAIDIHVLAKSCGLFCTIRDSRSSFYGLKKLWLTKVISILVKTHLHYPKTVFNPEVMSHRYGAYIHTSCIHVPGSLYPVDIVTWCVGGMCRGLIWSGPNLQLFSSSWANQPNCTPLPEKNWHSSDNDELENFFKLQKKTVVHICIHLKVYVVLNLRYKMNHRRD